MVKGEYVDRKRWLISPTPLPAVKRRPGKLLDGGVKPRLLLTRCDCFSSGSTSTLTQKPAVTHSKHLWQRSKQRTEPLTRGNQHQDHQNGPDPDSSRHRKCVTAFLLHEY